MKKRLLQYLETILIGCDELSKKTGYPRIYFLYGQHLDMVVVYAIISLEAFGKYVGYFGKMSSHYGV